MAATTGVGVLLQDADGNTHLHNAVVGPEDLPDLVAALLVVGLPPNAVNKDGDTALHIAARAGHVGVSLRLNTGSTFWMQTSQPACGFVVEG